MLDCCVCIFSSPQTKQIVFCQPQWFQLPQAIRRQNEDRVNEQKLNSANSKSNSAAIFRSVEISLLFCQAFRFPFSFPCPIETILHFSVRRIVLTGDFAPSHYKMHSQILCSETIFQTCEKKRVQTNRTNECEKIKFVNRKCCHSWNVNKVASVYANKLFMRIHCCCHIFFIRFFSLLVVESILYAFRMMTKFAKAQSLYIVMPFDFLFSFTFSLNIFALLSYNIYMKYSVWNEM